MSKSDYMAFQRERQNRQGAVADKIDLALSDKFAFSRQGTLDFIDNTLDKIERYEKSHVRATVANPNSDAHAGWLSSSAGSNGGSSFGVAGP